MNNHDLLTYLWVEPASPIEFSASLIEATQAHRSCANLPDVAEDLWYIENLLTCTCVGIHSGRVEPASPIELTTSRVEALQARRSCVSSRKIFTQSFLHRVWPKTHGPEIGSRSALIVVAHVFSWPPARLRNVRGGVGRRRSLISSQSGRLAA